MFLASTDWSEVMNWTLIEEPLRSALSNYPDREWAMEMSHELLELPPEERQEIYQKVRKFGAAFSLDFMRYLYDQRTKGCCN